MSRIVKNTEARRLEIMAAAQQRFEKQGYTKTAIESIIQDVGIAKGTFYYYFRSKQDILRAIVEDIILKVEAYFSSIVKNKKLTAIQKLHEIFVGHKKQEMIQLGIMEIVHLPENRELQEQLNIESIKLIAPLITDVLLQGYKESVFKKQASLESVQIFLAGIQFILDSGLFDWTTKQRTLFLKEIQKIFESLVDAKAGTLNFIVTKR